MEDGKLQDITDYKGNPVDKSKAGGWVAAGLILGTELSERICVIGISMNLVTYLVGDLHLSSPKSATIVTNFMGTLNLLALLGGFLADARLGRYLSVLIFGSITALGVTLLTLATSIPALRPPPCGENDACVEANGAQMLMLYAALYIVALGGGGIKSNVSGFGSDQFDHNDPKEEKAMAFFFNRFYFFISIGSLFAVTVLIYVQDNFGRGWGYGVSAASMLVAVVVLLCGSSLYRFKKPQGSPLTTIWRVLLLAWRKRNLHHVHPPLLNGHLNSMVPHTETFQFLDKAAIIEQDKMNESWVVSSVTEVEEVKMVIKLLPIWGASILFWTIYAQMTTFSVEQASIMDRKIGSFVVPAGSFSLFLFATILLFTSLNERVFVPVTRKLTNNVKGLTSLQRIGIGLVFSIAAMVAAALIENERKKKAILHSTQISAFWIVPQFFLVGAGEAFAYVGQLEFFIREAPDRMKSMSTGLFLSSVSMGFYFSSVMVTIVDKATKKTWLRSNMNTGKLYNFYWMLAVLGVLNFFAFLYFAKNHQYKFQIYSSKSSSTALELEKNHNIEGV